jgi:lysozyme family protein
MTRYDVAAAIIERVLIREGAVADVHDGMGITYFGQTADWCAQFGLVLPATRERAAANYRTWLDRTGLIDVCDVLDPLADGVIDYAVHSGHQRAIRSLQAALGVRPDGVMGVETRGALAVADRRVAAGKIVADRADFAFGLIGGHPAKYAKFARGWGHRISEQIRGLVA